jgi:hypothetical protein
VKKEVRAIPAENNGARSRSGGMNIFLASPDGHVVSGGVAGLLVAASLVEVLLLTFHKNLNAYEFDFSSNICI